jgi:S1-C subfamily serine protease
VLSGSERIRIGDTELSFHPIDPIRAKTTVGLSEERPRLSAVMRQRGQSAIQRLRIEKKLRNLTIAAGGTILAVILVVVLLVTGVLGGGGGIDKSAIISAAGPGTVLVKSNQGETGSGWALDAGKGLIITNGHVVNGGQTFQVEVGDKLVPASVVGDAPCDDLAVLRVSSTRGLKTLPLGSQSSVKEGDDVVALGYPVTASAGAQLTATAGVVSVAKTRYQEETPDIPLYPNVIQIDAALNPGNSGGPLMNKDKKLIGVNSAVRTESKEGRAIQNQNYAIGVDRVKPVVNYLKTGRSIAWVGFNLSFPSTEELGSLPPGAITSAAVKGSPADKAGVGGKRLLITGVNGQAVRNTLASYCSAAGSLQSGQEATFTVQDISDETDPGKARALKLKVP